MFKVLLSRQARQYYTHAPAPVAKRLANVFKSLESNIHPSGSKSLHGKLEGLWRIRIGNIRIIYEPLVDKGEIRIIKIGSRGDVY